MSQLTEYGELASEAIELQVPAPAGERWKSAEATPEVASPELEETLTLEPRRLAAAAGAVTEPVGLVLSTVTVRVALAKELPALSVVTTRRS